MNQHSKYRRILAVLSAVVLAVMLIIPTALPVSAANRRFITALRVEAGEDAVAKLEADGWSVTMVGLNATPEPSAQVYLAYKYDTGSPITNVIVSPDVGDSFTDANGIVYQCVSHTDADAGFDGASAGCLYATQDTRAGSPLVGLDVLRGNSEEGEVLYPITNDGAEIVRTPQGAPADLERGSDTDVIYLAQIRDGIVKPYIGEIGVITDIDKWNAVYTACERGYNYYVDGDIDDSSDTYTIIGYERTADAAQAVTNIAAVSAKAVQSLEDEQIVDDPSGQSKKLTAPAITVSGAEYVRVSGKPISADVPYYIYRSKDSKAGNPISMLYAEKPEQKQNFLFGSWANGYFFSPGVTTAYTYCMNEDIYTALWEDQTVCTKAPVQLLEQFTLAGSTQETQAPEETTLAPATGDEAPAAGQTQASDAAEKDGTDKTVRLAMLTPRDGLPASSFSLTGMRDPSAPYVEHTERGDRVNKYQASIFSKGGGIALIIGGVVIVAVAVYAIIRKKRTDGKKSEDSKKPKQGKKSKKQHKSKKSR